MNPKVKIRVYTINSNNEEVELKSFQRENVSLYSFNLPAMYETYKLEYGGDTEVYTEVTIV